MANRAARAFFFESASSSTPKRSIRFLIFSGSTAMSVPSSLDWNKSQQLTKGVSNLLSSSASAIGICKAKTLGTGALLLVCLCFFGSWETESLCAAELFLLNNFFWLEPESFCSIKGWIEALDLKNYREIFFATSSSTGVASGVACSSSTLGSSSSMISSVFWNKILN